MCLDHLYKAKHRVPKLQERRLTKTDAREDGYSVSPLSEPHGSVSQFKPSVLFVVLSKQRRTRSDAAEHSGSLLFAYRKVLLKFELKQSLKRKWTSPIINSGKFHSA